MSLESHSAAGADSLTAQADVGPHSLSHGGLDPRRNHQAPAIAMMITRIAIIMTIPLACMCLPSGRSSRCRGVG